MRAGRGPGQRARSARNRDSVVEVLPIERGASSAARSRCSARSTATRCASCRIGGESLEFCGGTHVRRAGDIGLFKIVGEAGIAQGVRRIEAVTGAGALDYLRQLEDELGKTGERLKAAPFEVAPRVDKLLGEQQASSSARSRSSSSGSRRAAAAATCMAEASTIKGIKVLAAAIEVDDAKVLRDTGDQLRDKLGSGVIVLAGIGGDRGQARSRW